MRSLAKRVVRYSEKYPSYWLASPIGRVLGNMDPSQDRYTVTPRLTAARGAASRRPEPRSAPRLP